MTEEARVNHQATALCTSCGAAFFWNTELRRSENVDTGEPSCCDEQNVRSVWPRPERYSIRINERLGVSATYVNRQGEDR